MATRQVTSVRWPGFGNFRKTAVEDHHYSWNRYRNPILCSPNVSGTSVNPRTHMRMGGEASLKVVLRYVTFTLRYIWRRGHCVNGLSIAKTERDSTPSLQTRYLAAAAELS